MHVLQTLKEGTRRYRLRDSKISNADLAKHLEVTNDTGGFNSLFFRDKNLAAIRATQDDVLVFHLYESVQTRLAEIAEVVIER